MNPDTTHHPHVWMTEMRNQSSGHIQVLQAEFLQDIQKIDLKNAVGERPDLDKFRRPCLNQLGEGKKEEIPQDRRYGIKEHNLNTV